MEICIVGWYGHKEFYELMSEVKNHKVIVISHNKNNDYGCLESINIANIGLEFGCYNYYLRNIWKSGNVLLMHDDMYVKDIGVFDEIDKLKCDCSYIFRDMAEEKANGGKHGRAIYCSERFLTFVKNFKCSCEWLKEKEDVHHNIGTMLPWIGNSHYGFWYDPFNNGHVSGKPPIGIRHYNDAIYHFHWMLGRIRDQRCGEEKNWPCPEVKMDVVNRIFFDTIIAGRRNQWSHMEREVNRYGT